MTYIALLTPATLNPQAGTFGLDMAYASARVALLGSNRAGLGAGSGLMAGLAAVVAETLLGGAVFCDVPHWAGEEGLRRGWDEGGRGERRTISTLETALPAELIRHSGLTASTRCLNLAGGLPGGGGEDGRVTYLASSLFLLTQLFLPSSFARIGPATSEMSDGDK